MRVGIHLPQYGRAASADNIEAVAREAENAGLAHLWVSDHILHPVGQTYPSPFLIEAFTALTWAAAATTTIQLGTSVLVVSQREPWATAKAFASLDMLSRGRVIAGIGAGWSEAEFVALGIDFSSRGSAMDKAITLMRQAWTGAAIDIPGQQPTLEVRVLPAPHSAIPIWVGGMSTAARRRALMHGDGLHLLEPDEGDVVAIVDEAHRLGRSDGFTVSARLAFRSGDTDPSSLRARLHRLQEWGVSDVVLAPEVATLAGWQQAIDAIHRSSTTLDTEVR